MCDTEILENGEMDDNSDTARAVVDHLSSEGVVLYTVAVDDGAIVVDIAGEVQPGDGVDGITVDYVGGDGVTDDTVIVDTPGVVRSRIGS